jgi:predicted nucleic acid-binding protein
MTVVSNASPLIVLYKCHLLEILHHLFGRVLIPEAVYDEVVRNTKDPLQSEAIMRSDFITVQAIPDQPFPLSHKLSTGEIQAIILAATTKADFLLLDDKRAQREARAYGLTVIPTFALLVKATQKGLIADFDSVLNELQQKNIFLSRELNLAARRFLDRK